MDSQDPPEVSVPDDVETVGEFREVFRERCKEAADREKELIGWIRGGQFQPQDIAEALAIQHDRIMELEEFVMELLLGASLEDLTSDELRLTTEVTEDG